MGSKTLKVKGKSKVLKQEGLRYYIAQKEGRAIDISNIPDGDPVPETIFDLQRPVMLKGDLGVVILGPGDALQQHGEETSRLDLLSLYGAYKSQGISVFKNLLGGKLHEVIVDPTVEDALEGNSVTFRNLMTAACPTKFYRIEKRSKYGADLYFALKLLKETPKVDPISTPGTGSAQPVPLSGPQPVPIEDVEILEGEDETTVDETQEADSWRGRPMSDRQRWKLQELGIAIDPIWTAGDASDIISRSNKSGPSASERQKNMLKNLGIIVPPGLTQKQASAMIKAERKLRGLV